MIHSDSFINVQLGDMGMSKQDIRDAIAAQFVAALEAGDIPWRRQWTGAQRPHNGNSKKHYRGVNSLILGLVQTREGYQSGDWYTFKGAQSLGAQVKKGAKATSVTFWKFLQKEDSDGQKRSIPLLRHFYVFNRAQIDGLPDLPKVEQVACSSEEAEAIVSGYPNPPKMETGGDRAYYAPVLDTVTMPPRTTFPKEAEYFSVLFHELAHSTGHKDRLNRSTLTESKRFGDAEYSKEELVAEITASFLLAEAGISENAQSNNLAYVQGWAKALSEAPRMVIEAAGEAQKAADHILGRKWGEEE